jgi:glyoxylase-like metal-dependent hydrolase (beta-lactamase superfamily II)
MFFAGYQSNPHKWIAALERFKELRPNFIIPGHGPTLKGVRPLDKHTSLLAKMIDVLQSAAEEGKDPKTMDIPDFVYSTSKRASKDDLEKWFRRTATSWIRRV